MNQTGNGTVLGARLRTILDVQVSDPACTTIHNSTKPGAGVCDTPNVSSVRRSGDCLGPSGAFSIGPGFLPTSGMSELAPSNIRYGRRKWTKRRTELRWGGHPFRQKRGKNGAPGDSFLTQERAGGLTPP